MPFGKTDTDRVYDHTYKKILKELKITPVRIDRKQHNNDIDKEIITELKKCDMIISDLTYARPSVYFEAGFGVGYSSTSKELEKPVIFTCRSDHKKHRDEDEYGDFTVHFDLQMKNILFWKNDNDRDFSMKLKNRIKFVISPLLKNSVENNKDKQKSTVFSNLALTTKISKIFNKGMYYISKNGFQDVIIDDGYSYNSRRKINDNINISYPISGFTNNSLIPTWVGTKVDHNLRKIIYFHTTQSLTKSQLDYLYYTLLKKPAYNIFPKHNGKKIKQFQELLIITCFNSVNSKNILNYLQTYSLNKKFDMYKWKGTQLVPKKLPKEWKNLFQVDFSEYGKFGASLKYDPKDKEKDERYSVTGNFLRYHKRGARYNENELIRLYAIPRTVNIKIFDSIKHEDHFSNILNDFLVKIKSDKF